MQTTTASPLLAASQPKKWWDVEFEAITPAQAAEISTPVMGSSAAQYSYDQAKADLAKKMIALAEEYKSLAMEKQAIAMVNLQTWLLENRQIEFKGPDLARFLRTFDIDTAKDQAKVAAFRAELAKQLTPADLAAIAAGPEAVAAHFKVHRSALGVTKDVLTTTAWAVTPAILSALIAYLTGSVLGLANLLPTLVQLNHTALNNIFEQFKKGVSWNSMSAGDVFRFVCSLGVLTATVAVAIWVGLNVLGGGITVAAFAAVSAALLIVQGIYTIGQYFLSSAQSNVKALIQAIPGLSDAAKNALKGMSDFTLSTLVAASPALLPFLLAMYAPTFSEEDIKVLTTELPRQAPDLKMTVDMNQPMQGSTMTPLELDARLDVLYPKTLATSSQFTPQTMVPTFTQPVIETAQRLDINQAQSLVGQMSQPLTLAPQPMTATVPRLDLNQAQTLIGQSQPLNLPPMPVPTTSVVPRLDAARARTLIDQSQPYQYEPLEQNPELLKNVLGAAAAVDYAKDALVASMRVLMPLLAFAGAFGLTGGL